MLESRSAYGYYGIAGGYTGESSNSQTTTTVRMPYREYKNKWADHKTVAGSYDKQDKTIEVIFSEEEMKAKTNLGNRYHLHAFYFKFDGVEEWVASIVEFNAKTYENAKRNARTYARQCGYTFAGDATRSEYCNQF